MKKPKIYFAWKTFCLCFLAIFLFASISFAQSVPGLDLVKKAKEYDGKAVTYEGELIGDIMERGKYSWINLKDGRQAIGIWIETELTKGLTHAGGYHRKGDIIEINGIFHAACPEHGGDLDIHAQKMRKVSSGRVIPEKLNLGKRNQAIILAGILCLVWILSLLKKK